MSLILNGTNGVSDVDGSASTPAVRGTDTNTGIFFPAADTIAFAEGGAEVARFDSSGNLGIGTSSPVSLLDVRGKLSVSNGSASYWQFDRNDSDGSLQFIDTATERMRIDTSGNLLVGATSPYGNEKFGVTSSNSGSGARVFNFYNSVATSTTRLNNTLGRISSNGSGADVCINFTDNVAYNYYFGGNNGGAYVVSGTNGVRLNSGATSWSSDSDERVKDIIEPITDAANKVSTLRAVIGKYKTDEEGIRRSFLIAQDVQAVLPEAVVAQEDEIGTLSLAYTDTIPLLVAAIQEQQAIITEQSLALQDLKSRIEALEQV
jgi:hypothetical protein